MKIVFTIIILAATCCRTTIATDDDILKCNRFLVDAVIRQLFELLRLLIKEGSINYNVPILDPWQIHHQEIILNGNLLSLEANLSNATVFGLGDFDLLNATFNKEDISLEFNLRFPLLTVHSEHYNLSGDFFGILPVIGEGLLHIEAHDLKFWSKVHLKQSEDGRSILIRDFLRTQFEIGTIVSRTQFDGNIDDILNTMIKDLLAGYLSRFSKYIADKNHNNVTLFLNQYFLHFESWRLIAALL
ncbi:uncharacterized protein [Battus philenor]|uniref:uncharacterized protein n=1 Tax=Battus philenor TaxID=42288 RepID=UPI0035D04F1B